MEIDVLDKNKIVEIWLTHEDENNTVISEFIKHKISECKRIKYKVVIFHSGNQDLLTCTEGLLKNNLAEITQQQRQEPRTA